MTETAATQPGPDALLDRPMNELVTFRIARLNAKLTAQASRLLAQAAGISLTQWRVFAVVDAAGGSMTASDLVRRTHFDKALISRTVRGMAEDGYLSTAPSPSDQRSTVLTLTAEGLRVAARARPIMRARQNALLGALSPEALAVLFDCIDTLDAAVDRIDAEHLEAPNP